MRPGPALWTRLPAGGWQIGFWADATGRTLIDIAEPSGALAYRLASARRAAPSIDAGWAGYAPDPRDASQCWALAIGHAPAQQCEHVVSFDQAPTRPGDQIRLPPQAPSGLWIVHNGLWAAAAIGYHTHVRLATESTQWLQPLHPVVE